MPFQDSTSADEGAVTAAGQKGEKNHKPLKIHTEMIKNIAYRFKIPVPVTLLPKAVSPHPNYHGYFLDSCFWIVIK